MEGGREGEPASEGRRWLLAGSDRREREERKKGGNHVNHVEIRPGCLTFKALAGQEARMRACCRQWARL